MTRPALLFLVGLWCCLSSSFASGVSLSNVDGASAVSAHRLSPSSAAGGWGQSAPGALWNVSFTRPEGVRWFLLYFPASLNATSSVPLSFFFHGYTGDAFNFFRYYGGFDGAERHRVTIVSGQGTNGGGNQPLGWNSGVCCLFSSPPQQWPNDVQFALTSLAAADALLKANHSASVDRSRVFSMGMSNGGMHSERLGCEQPHVFRAVASVTGVTVESPGGLGGLTTCTQLYSNVTLARSFSVLLVHGLADPTVPWNGTGLPLPFPPVLADAESWRARMGCSTSSSQTLKAGNFSNAVWQGCTQQGSQLELVTVNGGGHDWFATPDFSSTDYVFDFFARFPGDGGGGGGGGSDQSSNSTAVIVAVLLVLLVVAALAGAAYFLWRRHLSGEGRQGSGSSAAYSEPLTGEQGSGQHFVPLRD